MAYAESRFGYQSDSTLDNKQTAFIDSDSSALLNHSVLEADMMQSPNEAFRKNSFANSNGVLSPAESQTWDHPFNNGLNHDPASVGAPSAFPEDSNVFLPQHNSHIAPYPNQHRHSSWAFDNGSGNSTPTTAGEFMPPPQYDGPHFIPQRSDGTHGNFGHQSSMPHHFPQAPQVQTPMSPHSHQDWMGMAEREMENRPSNKRMRPNSPPRSLGDYQRGDGIRKKNGRIDIPQERNIHNIENLIEQATDDDELKELKQQKRLLRNREAALASRQRKKKHTEELEIKEKSYTQKIASLEAQANNFIRERERWARDHDILQQKLQEADRALNTMEEERRMLISKHTEEASQLRRQVSSLRDQLEAGPAPAMSDMYSEMEALNMGIGAEDWQQQNWGVGDYFPSVGEVFHNQSEPVKSEPVQEKRVTLALATRGKEPAETQNDPPIAKGLLFMLLLCGAFVASKPANSRSSVLPDMPANVLAAAPMVLNNILSEFDTTSGAGSSRTVVDSGRPRPSTAAYASSRGGKIERVHRSITATTKQQEMDQAFSLTPAQYASMTSGEFYEQPPPSTQNEALPPQRRPLAEALANLEEHPAHGSKAEIYTRSLLWEQVPADVIRQFKEIVRDHNAVEARQQRQQDRRPSHDFT